eukprot:scaffold14328_cov143-Isochrysis_galbana.AAC.1
MIAGRWDPVRPWTVCGYVRPAHSAFSAQLLDARPRSPVAGALAALAVPSRSLLTLPSIPPRPEGTEEHYFSPHQKKPTHTRRAMELPTQATPTPCGAQGTAARVARKTPWTPTPKTAQSRACQAAEEKLEPFGLQRRCNKPQPAPSDMPESTSALH